MTTSPHVVYGFFILNILCLQLYVVCVLSMFWEGMKQVFLNVFPLCFALNFEGIVWVVLALLTLG